jgi:hypothetical protein
MVSAAEQRDGELHDGEREAQSEIAGVILEISDG